MKPLSYRAQLTLLLFPYLLGTLLLVAAPGLLTVLLSFTHYDAISPPVFARFANFRELRIDPLVAIALKNTFTFAALAVPLRLAGAFGLALVLRPAHRGVGAYLAAVYLPSLLPDVANALIWLWVFNPLYGPLNFILRAVGLPAPAWLADQATALPALVIMSLFQIGEGFVVLLAAMLLIPREYYEMALTDGANRWQRFAYITLPLVAPWLLLLACREIILMLQSPLVPALLMTGGGPYYATLFLPLLAFEEAVDNLLFGESAAMMVVMYALTGLVLLAFFGLARRWTHVEQD